MSESKTTELRGAELARAAFNHILDHPETWDQTHWHCGTTHCFYGHCQILAGKQETMQPETEVRGLLGISVNESTWLSSSRRSLSEIRGFVAKLINGEAGYNRAGYNRAGYNRDGYDRDGYDLDGYDLDGYNLDGYNLDGYNRDGYNRDGYNRDGYNRDGVRLLPL